MCSRCRGLSGRGIGAVQTAPIWFGCADVVVPVRRVSAWDVRGCSMDTDVYAVCAGQ